MEEFHGSPATCLRPCPTQSGPQRGAASVLSPGGNPEEADAGSGPPFWCLSIPPDVGAEISALASIYLEICTEGVLRGRGDRLWWGRMLWGARGRSVGSSTQPLIDEELPPPPPQPPGCPPSGPSGYQTSNDLSPITGFAPHQTPTPPSSECGVLPPGRCFHFIQCSFSEQSLAY